MPPTDTFVIAGLTAPSTPLPKAAEDVSLSAQAGLYVL
jgi:hypothetical protein